MKKEASLVLATIIVLTSAFFLLKQNPSIKKESSGISPTASIQGAMENVTNETSEISLVIASPENNSKVNTQSITISGKTASQAEIFINDRQTKADGEGNFSIPITLEEGQNEILISANDASGHAAEKVITVSYEPVKK